MAVSATAAAHVSIEEDEVAAGSSAIVTFAFSHGCEGSPTTQVRIQMPESIPTVAPTINANWDVEKVTETLDAPIEGAHGEQITERVSEVVYTARTPVEDGFRDTFELSVTIPEDAAGQTIYFPTIQTCEAGETAWIEIPAEGQDPDELESPAPGVDVVAGRATPAATPSRSTTRRCRCGWSRQAVSVSLLAALSLVLFGGPAAAHAELISVSPADGEVLDAAPAEVVLTFSEPVSLTGGSVRCARRRRRGRLDGDDVWRTRRSPPRLPTVSPTAPTPSSSRSSPSTRTASVVRRCSTSARRRPKDSPATTSTSGATRRAGEFAPAPSCCRRSATPAPSSPPGRCSSRCTPIGVPTLRAVTSRAAVLGAVALVAAVPFRIARLGGGLDALRDNDVLMSALRGPVGISTAVTANALLVVAVLVDRRAPAMARRSLFALVALAGFSIEGHTRATERRWAMVASDVVHLAAGAMWLGGIVALVVAFRTSTDTGRLATIVRRFSDSALLAVGVVAVTGVIMAWIILPIRRRVDEHRLRAGADRSRWHSCSSSSPSGRSTGIAWSRPSTT